jgi:hypothetical protein
MKNPRSTSKMSTIGAMRKPFGSAVVWERKFTGNGKKGG